MPTGRYRREPLLLRFWKKVRVFPGCWKWVGGKANYGYGSISVGGGRLMGAHRVSWILHNGPIPDGLFVLHKCDNPECTRPDHLFLGTHQDNMRDCATKGRTKHGMNQAKGSKHYMTKLTEDQVVEIRKRRADGEPCWKLAEEFGMCQSGISNITRRRTWTHVS